MDDMELNQWCIEQAMRWPVISSYGGGGYGSQMPRMDTDADIIGRATKIMTWIKAAH
jgi:hypothetical protein